MNDTEPTPHFEVTIAAPVDAVWDALRDKERIRHWHGWEFDGLDAEVDLIYFTQATEDAKARVLDVQGGDRFELEPYGDGTRVRLTRAPHGSDPEWDAYYDDVTEGWITFVQQLKFALERHPGQARRTLFFSSAAEASPIEALDLADIAGRAPGEPYQAALAGEDVSGEVWFRSAHQLGVTVAGWGDGLLILSRIPQSATKATSSVLAVLTTYGLDDAALDGLRERWTAMWAERYPDGSNPESS